MRGTVILSVLLGTMAFAGCLQSEAASKDSQVTNEQSGPAEFTDDTGAIRGTVSDEEGTPLADVQIGLVGGTSVSTLSASDGSYILNNLEPGRHVLAAQKLGYESVSRAVDVQAGEVAAAAFVLKPIAVLESYHDAFILKGYFDCTWYVSGSSGPCGFTTLNGTTGNPLEPLWVNSKRKWNYPAAPHLMTITNEITWQKGTAATADRLRVIMSHGPINGAERSSSHNFCVTGGVNPVLMRWERDEAGDDGRCLTGTQRPSPGPGTIHWEKGLLLQSFVSVDPGQVANAATQPFALAYQQSFELHVSRFYGEKAPENWSAIPDT